MKNFNRGNKYGGRGKSFGDRDSRSRSMHRAVCDECGNDCEVPFRPTGDKPIFCNECFQGKRGGASNKFGDKDFKKSGFGEKKMYSAVCSKCGKTCEVPFRPTGGKPVYCDECFGKEGSAPQKGDNHLNKQFEILSEKLDKILKLLTPAVSAKKPLKKNVEKKAKISGTKKLSKKVVLKKTVAKKTKKKKTK
jgi:CxxC-x17-CxxC domain-containing protein